MKIKKVLTLIVIGLTVPILESCFSTEHFLLNGIEFYGMELTNPTEKDDARKQFMLVSDTLRDRLYLEISGEAEYQHGYMHNVSVVNKCYATSVPKKLDNHIVIDSIQLKLDSDIYFANDTIKANTDLWSHPLLKEYRWFYESDKYYVFNYTVKIGFTESFYQKIAIPPKNYSIELTCGTSDDKAFVKTRELFIKIDKNEFE